MAASVRADDAQAPQPVFRYIESGRLCTPHHCGSKCCPANCSLAPGSRAHIIFAHIEKTGGSAIECATQSWQANGWWDNMGHSSVHPLQVYIKACSGRCHVPTVLVVGVRNPYRYWASVFTFGWIGGVKTSDVTYWFSKYRHLGLEAMRNGPMSSFARFMLEWAPKEGRSRSISLLLHKACGTPCKYDFLLRFESLERDWQRLIGMYGLPAVALPRLNTVATTEKLSPPSTALTSEIVDIINDLEASIFTQFGYERMNATSLATSSSSPCTASGAADDVCALAAAASPAQLLDPWVPVHFPGAEPVPSRGGVRKRAGVALLQGRWTSSATLPGNHADLRRALLRRHPDGWLPVSHRNLPPGRWEVRLGITGARAATWYYYTPGCSDLFLGVLAAHELHVSFTKVSAAIELTSVVEGLASDAAAVAQVARLLHASAMGAQFARAAAEYEVIQPAAAWPGPSEINTSAGCRLLWDAHLFQPSADKDGRRRNVHTARLLANFNGVFSGVWDSLLPALMRRSNLTTLLMLQTTSVAPSPGERYHHFPELLRTAPLTEEVFFDRTYRPCKPLANAAHVVCNSTPLTACAWKA